MKCRVYAAAALMLSTVSAFASDGERDTQREVETAVESAIIGLAPSLDMARESWVGYGSKPELRWAKVVSSQSGKEFFIDLKTASGSAEEREAWMRTEFQSGTFESLSSATQLTQLTVFFCRTRQVAALQWTYVDASGSPLQTDEGSRFSRRAVAPESALEAVLEYVCGIR